MNITNAFKELDEIHKEKVILNQKERDLINQMEEEDTTYKENTFDMHNNDYGEKIIGKIQKYLSVLGIVYIRNEHRIDNGRLYDFRRQHSYQVGGYMTLLLKEWPTILVRIKNKDIRENFHTFMKFIEAHPEEIATIEKNISLELPIKTKEFKFPRKYEDKNGRNEPVIVSKLILVDNWRSGKIHLNELEGTSIELHKHCVAQLKDELETMKAELEKVKQRRETFTAELDRVGMECFKKWLVLREI